MSLNGSTFHLISKACENSENLAADHTYPEPMYNNVGLYTRIRTVCIGQQSLQAGVIIVENQITRTAIKK